MPKCNALSLSLFLSINAPIYWWAASLDLCQLAVKLTAWICWAPGRYSRSNNPISCQTKNPIQTYDWLRLDSFRSLSRLFVRLFFFCFALFCFLFPIQSSVPHDLHAEILALIWADTRLDSLGSLGKRWNWITQFALCILVLVARC